MISMELESKSIKAAVAKLTFRTQAFIDGKYVNAESGKTYVSVNPATGKPLADIASCDAVDLDKAVKAARRTFDASREYSRAQPRRPEQH